MDLSETQVDNAALNHLLPFSKLVDLNLWLTHTGDAGMPTLAKMTQLQRLNLDHIGHENEHLTSAGLQPLLTLQNLNWLHLGKTHIDDAGLRSLAGLPQLETLILHDCEGITDAGVADLKAALPKLEIDR